MKPSDDTSMQMTYSNLIELEQQKCFGERGCIEGNLLQQLVVGEAEGFLQQNRQNHSEDEETFLLRHTLLVTDLHRNEPHQRGQQQRHQPEECSVRKTPQKHTEISL